jgi:hypothetical protein
MHVQMRGVGRESGPNGGTTSHWSCSEGSRLPGLEGWLLSAAKRDIHEALRKRGCHKQAGKQVDA